MASREQKMVNDEDLDKILNKAFDDIRKKVHALILKREKKLLREVKTSSKQTSSKKGREQPRKEENKKEKREYRRSHSSSSDSESH